MKKLLIGALVAAIILQVWQTVSWTFANVHGAEQQYTENQDAILKVLSENLKEGEYFLPTVPPNHSPEEMAALQENVMGKPWATVNYHPKFEMNLPMNMLRGFAVNLISTLLLCWVLLKFADLNFTSAILTTVSIGFIGYFTIIYMNHIWFQGSTMGYLIDAVVAWGLVGAWLGWYLPEKAR